MSAQKEALAKAEVLSQALPWLLKYQGATIVIKFGGNAMVDNDLINSFAEDVTFLKLSGINPVIVHGGGPQISQALKKSGIETKFVKGLRVTDEKSIGIIKSVLVNEIQVQLTKSLNSIYEFAVGISGDEKGLLQGKRINQIDGELVDLGLVGEITSVKPDPLREIIAGGKIPVLSTLATGSNGELLNINADLAASSIAIALGARKLIILTDVIGLMSDFPNPESLISQITTLELAALLPKLDEGMKPKMQAALLAVEKGVPRAHVIDGRIAHGLLVEIFTDQGAGTMVVSHG